MFTNDALPASSMLMRSRCSSFSGVSARSDAEALTALRGVLRDKRARLI